MASSERPNGASSSGAAADRATATLVRGPAPGSTGSPAAAQTRPAVSGLWEGSAATGRVVDLRIDVDWLRLGTPVMNRVSGDFLDIQSFMGFKFRVYRESWIVDNPKLTVNWDTKKVTITGVVRFWKGGHSATWLEIVIPWSDTSRGPAVATFTELFGTAKSYVSNYKSDCFREVTLEVDVTKSTNTAPTLPQYNTGWHDTCPPLWFDRDLNMQQSYREAGVKLTIPGDRTVIDDSASTFSSWSPVELHDAMETHFSRLVKGPSWQLWGLLAGRFDDVGTGGIMFDWSGAGKPPERQGFAVFRKHSWFNNLVTGTPKTQAQAASMRHFLYTWVHEAGHAFNFMHSWDKARPDSLSWMNYDWRYDARNGANAFWGNFYFRFDDEELLHLRHGDRASVALGGDAWGSGTHLETPPGAMSEVEGTAPLELLVRSKGYFGFLEPVSVELRLRNLLSNTPVDVDARLDPELGAVTVYVQRPRGDIVAYRPPHCRLATPEIKRLAASDGRNEGLDRHSEEVFLSYGVDGFYFGEPGEYLVRAMYQGAGDVLIVSNTHRVRIGAPRTKDEDRLAGEFLTYEVGASLYLGGSPSPFLQRGMEVLEEVAVTRGDSVLGVRAATTVAKSAARTFHRVQDGAVTLAHAPDPERALAVSASAVRYCREQESRALNLSYHELVRNRADWLVTLDMPDQAGEELATLRSDLAGRGVNEPVLADIARYERALTGGDGDTQ